MPKNCVQRILLSFLVQFRLHASSHYSLISELISADIKSELRVMLRKFFTRVGYVYDIVSSSVEIPTWAAKLHTHIYRSGIAYISGVWAVVGILMWSYLKFRQSVTSVLSQTDSAALTLSAVVALWVHTAFLHTEKAWMLMSDFM